MSAAEKRPGFFTRFVSRVMGISDAPAPRVSGTSDPTVPLTSEDEARVEDEVRRMMGELRAKPSQEKEDRVGIEIASLPEAERDLVPAILLRIVAEEAGRGR
jgi:hypothetical protein